MRVPHRIAPVGPMRDQAARGYRPLPVSAVIVFAASSATFIDRSAMRRVSIDDLVQVVPSQVALNGGEVR